MLSSPTHPTPDILTQDDSKPLEVGPGECSKCCKNAPAHVALPVSIAILANFNRFKSTMSHAEYGFAKVRLHGQQLCINISRVAQTCTNCLKNPLLLKFQKLRGSFVFLRSKDMTIFSISHPGPQGCGQRIASLLHASGGSIGPDGSATIPQQRRKTRIETPQVHDNIFEYLQDL